MSAAISDAALDIGAGTGWEGAVWTLGWEDTARL
jgi:hypothetical protein